MTDEQDILAILDRAAAEFYGPYEAAAAEIRSLRKQVEDVRNIVRPASRYSVDIADSVKVRSYNALRRVLYDQEPVTRALAADSAAGVG